MDLGRRLCSVTPHEDIENGFPRKLIPYHLVMPVSGMNQDTGLVFFIEGFGGHPSKEYTRKLLSYLADQYNCIAVCVEYFDIEMKRPSLDSFCLDKVFFEQFEKKLNVKLPDFQGYSTSHILQSMAKWLVGSGLSSFPDTARVINHPKDCYQSFGLLPAIDHLQVMIEVQQLFDLNSTRFFILGTSYGGYIADLLGKIAPETFNLIVDNSGFTKTLADTTIDDFHTLTSINGCSVVLYTKSLWSSDPESECFFDIHNSEIRSLMIHDHCYPSKSTYFCAHSRDDMLVPAKEKVEFKTLRGASCEVELDLIDEDKVDGKLYKNLEHGMNASLRSLFDKAYNHYLSSNPTLDGHTDFDRESEYDFPCSNGYRYHIKFTRDDVKLTLHPPE